LCIDDHERRQKSERPPALPFPSRFQQREGSALPVVFVDAWRPRLPKSRMGRLIAKNVFPMLLTGANALTPFTLGVVRAVLGQYSTCQKGDVRNRWTKPSWNSPVHFQRPLRPSRASLFARVHRTYAHSHTHGMAMDVNYWNTGCRFSLAGRGGPYDVF
jgi:hypothetical protein